MAKTKAEWPQGPWTHEVDSLGWFDQETGLTCQIERGPGGHLCGYVEIPEGHPLHGVDYSARITKQPSRRLFGEWFLIEDDYESAGGLFQVHGGVTYSGGAFWDRDEGHWYGFDCGHAGDISPAYETERGGVVYVYRDLQYVIGQCTVLARQIRDIAA